MYEAYAALAAQYERYQVVADADGITFRALEDIHMRASGMVEGADFISGDAHTSGYTAILKIHLDDKVPDLDAIRSHAAAVIADGYNLEEDKLDFAHADMEEDAIQIEDVFAAPESDTLSFEM